MVLGETQQSAGSSVLLFIGGMSETSTRLTSDSIISASEEVLSSSLGGEVVLLEMENGVYYSLNEVGARIWELIGEPTSVKEVCRHIVDEYDVDPEQCSRDTLAVLSDLTDRGLAEVRAEIP